MSENTIDVTDENFEEKVLKASTPVLVDFWAPWCGPCLAIAPTLDNLASEYEGKVAIAKMNVDENKHIPTQHGVRSIPFMVLFKDGEVQDSIAGAVPKAKLSAMLDKALN
ncbi:MAG: thioredoxin [Oligoflexales bacterium]